MRLGDLPDAIFGETLRVSVWCPKWSQKLIWVRRGQEWSVTRCHAEDGGSRQWLVEASQSNQYSQNWVFWRPFSTLKLAKFPPPFGGGFTFYYTSHVMKRFLPHVHRTRLNGQKIEYNSFCWHPEMDGNLFRANRARPGSQKVTVIHKWVYGIEFLSTKLKILHLINNMKLGPQTHFGAKYQSEGNIQLVTKLWNLSSRHRRSRIDFEVLCQQTKTLRRSRILWGNGFRPCQNLIQWKDGW